MCWIGGEGDKHIAKEEKRVFKILYRKPDAWSSLDKSTKHIYTPPYFWGDYRLGLMRTEKLGITHFLDMGDWVRIEQGLHCYSNSCAVSMTDEKIYSSIKIYLLKQTHTRLYELHLSRIGILMEAKVVECVIPVGAEYWENDDGEIVTNKLTPVKELKI